MRLAFWRTGKDRAVVERAVSKPRPEVKTRREAGPMKDADALREMTMGKAVAESAFDREIRHLAFPFGDRASFRRSHVVMAEQAGFASAVSTISGIVDAQGRTNLRALPRISCRSRAAPDI